MEQCKISKNVLKKSAELLNLAFQGDPLFQKIFVNEKNPGQMTQLFSFILQSGLMEGGILLKDSPNINAIALLIPPKKKKHSCFNFPFLACLKLLFTYKIITLKRLSTIHNSIAKVHKKLVTEDHYYLSVIGVHPKTQGQGIGKQILLSIIDTVDHEQKSIYLETQNEKNVNIYQKYGFKVIHQEIIKPFSKDEIFFMLRQPANSK